MKTALGTPDRSNITLEKIISGGQTGADIAGLDAAIACGIPTGGTAPMGWFVQDENGNDIQRPELGTKYGLVECNEFGYPPRTRKNVQNSDATLWVGFTESPGGKLTIDTARKLSKLLVINPSAHELAMKLSQHRVKILNVAGNRASDFNPGIYQKTYDLVTEAIAILRSGSFE